MSQIASTETGQSRRTLLIVSMLTVCFFAVANLPWTLDDYDQAKQAFVSFQMIGQQRWLYQTTPHEGMGARGGRHSFHHISGKPPAVAWISAALYRITRSWDFAWRFPSFVAAIALAVLVFRGARTFGDLPALCALAAFSLNLLSVRLATLVRTDMPLALVTFAIGLLMFEKIRTRTSWTTRDRVALCLVLTAAMFVKGPIVWAFVLPPLVIYQLRRKWRPTFPNAWSGWIPWVASLALFYIWLISGIRFIDGFYEDVVLNEFAARFHEGIHRSQPLLFYIPHLLQKFAPWSLLIIGLLVAALRKTKATTGKWLGELSPEMFWLMTWALGGIVVMSLIPSKRVDRIFPAVPPLCMLLAAQIKASMRQCCSRSPHRRVRNNLCLNFYRCVFGDAGDRRLPQRSRCIGEIWPRSSPNCRSGTSAIRSSTVARRRDAFVFAAAAFLHPHNRGDSDAARFGRARRSNR